MNYWLFITTPQNWEVTKSKNILGVTTRHERSLSRLSNGDKCLIYIKKTSKRDEPKVAGEYEAASEVYRDSKPIFNTPALILTKLFR